MAIEDFFDVEMSLQALKKCFEEKLVLFNKEYDEFTLQCRGYTLWIYAYTEGDVPIEEALPMRLCLNIKYESQTPQEVRAEFKNKLLALGFAESIF